MSSSSNARPSTAALEEQTRPAGGLAELGRRAAPGLAEGDPSALVVCDQVVRIFATEGVEVQALQGLDLVLAEGELTAVVGASGSGKSTLLNILAGLDQPTAGSVRVGGVSLTELDSRSWVRYRRHTVGFVWQQTARNLVPYLTAGQNVAVPLRFASIGRRQRKTRVDELLELAQVGHCRDRRPEQMSGGEQQRVAIAVACANQPKLLLADEPTGELDLETAAEVFGALRTVNEQLGTTVLIVTHDPDVSTEVRRTVAMRNGRTSTETLRHTTTGEDGQDTRHEVEYAVLDRAGRLQLPADMTARLNLRDRVRLEEAADHIGVWPGNEQAGASDESN